MSFVKHSSVSLQVSSGANEEFVKRQKISPDYFVVRCRFISAGEYYGPNDNFDYFPEEELKKSYQTFIGKGVYTDHNSDNVENAIGKILDATWNDESKYVEGVIGIDRKAAPHIVRGIEMGYIDSVSMGTRVSYSDCSICNNRAYKEDEYCDHIRHSKGRVIDGKLCYEINHGLNFFEISIVGDPADKQAKVLEILSDDIISRGQSIIGRLINVNNPKLLREAGEYLLKVAKVINAEEMTTERAKTFLKQLEKFERQLNLSSISDKKVQTRELAQLLAKRIESLKDLLAQSREFLKRASFPSEVYAETIEEDICNLDERVEKLEKRVKKVEKELESLEGIEAEEHEYEELFTKVKNDMKELDEDVDDAQKKVMARLNALGKLALVRTSALDIDSDKEVERYADEVNRLIEESGAQFGSPAAWSAGMTYFDTFLGQFSQLVRQEKMDESEARGKAEETAKTKTREKLKKLVKIEEKSDKEKSEKSMEESPELMRENEKEGKRVSDKRYSAHPAGEMPRDNAGYYNKRQFYPDPRDVEEEAWWSAQSDKTTKQISNEWGSYRPLSPYMSPRWDKTKTARFLQISPNIVATKLRSGNIGLRSAKTGTLLRVIPDIFSRDARRAAREIRDYLQREGSLELETKSEVESGLYPTQKKADDALESRFHRNMIPEMKRIQDATSKEILASPPKVAQASSKAEEWISKLETLSSDLKDAKRDVSKFSHTKSFVSKTETLRNKVSEALDELLQYQAAFESNEQVPLQIVKDFYEAVKEARALCHEARDLLVDADAALREVESKLSSSGQVEEDMTTEETGEVEPKRRSMSSSEEESMKDETKDELERLKEENARLKEEQAIRLKVERATAVAQEMVEKGLIENTTESIDKAIDDMMNMSDEKFAGFMSSIRLAKPQTKKELVKSAGMQKPLLQIGQNARSLVDELESIWTRPPGLQKS